MCPSASIGRKRCSRHTRAGRISWQHNGSKFWLSIQIFGILQVHLNILHPCIRPQRGVFKSSEQCQSRRITRDLSGGGGCGCGAEPLRTFTIQLYMTAYDSKGVCVSKPTPSIPGGSCCRRCVHASGETTTPILLQRPQGRSSLSANQQQSNYADELRHLNSHMTIARTMLLYAHTVILICMHTYIYVYI